MDANSGNNDNDVTGRQSAGDHQPYEPALNLPGIITLLILALVGIHVLRTWMLSENADLIAILTFGFIPASYGLLASQLPVSMAGLWTPLTHAFLHSDWTHLFVNLLWMTAFGSPIAKRFGAKRFLLLSAICAIGGAALHYVFFVGDFVPMIGASGAVSGYMGAASRFAFNSDTPGFQLRHDGPALGLLEAFRNRKFLIFLGVWMVLNFIFGTGVIPLAGEDVAVAWQAHVGGFMAGILFFSMLDPVKSRPE